MVIPLDQRASISSGIPSIRYSFGTPIFFPRISPVKKFSKHGTGILALVESLGSWPAIASNIIAASVTDFVIGPAWSSDEANATTPHLEHLPYVGFKPVIPTNAAGCLIDPPVSVPVAPRQRSAATAAAEPPDEPPGVKFLTLSFSFHGFITSP